MDIENDIRLDFEDVQSFYWNYICHGPIGSCQRFTDPMNEDSSRFEVADQTNIELFCCAAVTGYQTVQMNMNQIGDDRDDVEINKKQESDGSWVICANQRTILKRVGYNQQRTLTCELILDNRRHSTLSSSILIKGKRNDLKACFHFEHRMTFRCTGEKHSRNISGLF